MARFKSDGFQQGKDVIELTLDGLIPDRQGCLPLEDRIVLIAIFLFTPLSAGFSHYRDRGHLRSRCCLFSPLLFKVYDSRVFTCPECCRIRLPLLCFPLSLCDVRMNHTSDKRAQHAEEEYVASCE